MAPIRGGAIVSVSCPSCGTVFHLPKAFHESLLESCKHFYCPNGHRMHYGEKDRYTLAKENDAILEENERLKKEVEELRLNNTKLIAKLDQLEARIDKPN